MDRFVPHLLPSRLPVLVYGFGMVQHVLRVEMIQARYHMLIRHDGVVYRCERRLLRSRVLEDIHDALEVIFGERAWRRLLAIILPEKAIVLHSHVILATYALLDSLRRADVRGRLVEVTRVELIVVDGVLLGRRHWDLLVITSAGRRENRLQMVFLRAY